MIGEFTGGAVATDQELRLARCRLNEVDDGPAVESQPPSAMSNRKLLPGRPNAVTLLAIL
jgi:hypothetical protein